MIYLQAITCRKLLIGGDLQPGNGGYPPPASLKQANYPPPASPTNHLPLHWIAMTENNSISSRPRVLSGMRPTGRLHLGNYMGALYNWVHLQDQYDFSFFIAHPPAPPPDYPDPPPLRQNIRDVALDFLSAGLDPQ